jgi:hypothetical protein
MNDVRRKVDAVFYPPPTWRSTWTRILVGFKRRSVGSPWTIRQDSRDRQSEAHFDFQCPAAHWQMVGTAACFPRELLADQLGYLRDMVTQLPRAR